MGCDTEMQPSYRFRGAMVFQSLTETKAKLSELVSA